MHVTLKGAVKGGFHWRQSRTQSRRRSRNYKSASDLVKIENRSCKRSHKLDGIGVGRIRTVPFSFDSAYDSDAYDPVKTKLSESQAEVSLFFGFHLLLRQSSFHWIISVGVISGIGRKCRTVLTPPRTPILDFDWVASADDSDFDSVATENQP